MAKPFSPLACIFLLFSFFGSMEVLAMGAAEALFQQHHVNVFQVRIIDKASGNKAAIGSGFRVSQEGMVATNYHVVSGFVLHPEDYEIQLIDHEEVVYTAELINFDVVHDLALIQANKLGGQSFEIINENLSKGGRIYSMGNPQDLGMMIVEGNYNGLVEGSRYRKYLFSGSLNGGMSGGPAINTSGKVIGINVSKGGEQLSFLVPAQHLIDLISASREGRLNSEDYDTHILESLKSDQDEYYSMLYDMSWATREFYEFDLPDKIHDSLKCWGHTFEKKKKRFDESHRHCRTEDSIYIDGGFYTGGFSFDYEIVSSDELNSFQFYSLLSDKYEMRKFANNNDKQDTTNLSCASDFVSFGDKHEGEALKWKVTTCVREYIDYPGLYDAGILAVQAGFDDDKMAALQISMMTSGISRENIEKMHAKLLRTVKWIK